LIDEREELRKLYYNTDDVTAATFIPAVDKRNIYDWNREFRVCAYCRVSTDNDAQLSSFELQQQHYRQLVGQRPNWKLLHIFADEGISGTSLKKRDAFNDMIARCKAGEFDLIVTKSVSRFARKQASTKVQTPIIHKLKESFPYQRPSRGYYIQ
jgi:hypothetical protein